MERKLADIWEKELGVKPIGVRDNFFDMGGHSLLAVRVFAQAEQTFGKRLPLATFFQAPTIEQLADIFRDKTWSAEWTALVPIQPNGSKPPFFCVHAHGGHVMFYHGLAQHLGAHVLRTAHRLCGCAFEGSRGVVGGLHVQISRCSMVRNVRGLRCVPCVVPLVALLLLTTFANRARR